MDYLLKPIEFSRFLQAIQKINKNPAVAAIDSSVQKDAYHFFNVDKKQVKIYLNDISYIESLKDYVKIHTGNSSIVTRLQIGELEKLLITSNLFRIHKSYVVNLDKVSAYGASHIEIDGQEIPIGRSYKELVMRELKR